MSTVVAENSQNFTYVQQVLVKYVELSKKLYKKTGLKNEFLETNAQKLNAVSSQLAHLLDVQIYFTVTNVSNTTKVIAEKTNQTKQMLIERSSKTKKELVQRTMSLKIVKKGENLGNWILSELEYLVLLLSKSISMKLALPKSTEQSEISAEEGKLSVTERSMKLLFTLNKLCKQIAEHYMNKVKSLSAFESVQEKYALVNIKTKEARVCLESFLEVFLTTVVTQNIVNPIFNTLQVNYIKSKENITIIIVNIKKTDVQNLLTKAKGSYQSLKQATIVSLDKEKLTLTFAFEFFKSSVQTIQKELTQLLTDVSALKVRFTKGIMDLYKLSLQEFKQKRTSKLGNKAVCASEEKQVDSTSTASPVQSKNEEEDQL